MHGRGPTDRLFCKGTEEPWGYFAIVKERGLGGAKLITNRSLCARSLFGGSLEFLSARQQCFYANVVRLARVIKADLIVRIERNRVRIAVRRYVLQERLRNFVSSQSGGIVQNFCLRLDKSDER